MMVDPPFPNMGSDRCIVHVFQQRGTGTAATSCVVVIERENVLSNGTRVRVLT